MQTYFTLSEEGGTLTALSHDSRAYLDLEALTPAGLRLHCLPWLRNKVTGAWKDKKPLS